MSKIKLSALSLVILVAGLASCKKDNPNKTPDPVPTPSISKTDSLEVEFNPMGSFTFYNFKDGVKVANSDSASTKWDIGFKYVDIIVNSHSSGPGAGGVITQKVSPTVTFDLLMKAPEIGYAYDTTSLKRAINTNIRTGWYNYNDATHAFTPKSDRFFIVKTADGKYAKLEILKVDYLSFNGPVPVTLKYKFRYTYQPDGSVNF